MASTEKLQAVLRRWPVVLAAVAAACLAALLTAGAGVAPPSVTYSATHTLYTGFSGGPTAPAGIQLPVLALLATTGEIPVRVAARVGSELEPAVLASRVTVTADSELGTLSVTAREGIAEAAVALADAYATEILAFANARAEDLRTQALDTTNEQIVTLESRVRQLDAQLGPLDPASAEAGLVRAQRDGAIRQYGLALERLSQLNDATDLGARLATLQAATAIPLTDEDLIAPPRSLRARLVIALVLGLAGGVVLALALHRLDDKVRSRRDAEDAFGLPVVAEVPNLPSALLRRGPVAIARPASYAAEAFRILRMALQLMPRWVLAPTRRTTDADEVANVLEDATSIEGQPKVVLVTSPAPGEGKTTTSANLAVSFGELGKVVIALDCDFRHPGLQQAFGGPPAARNADATGPGATPALSEMLVDSGAPNVWLLPRPSTADLLTDQFGASAIAQARELADIVVVDSGPVLTVNEAAALVPQVDAVLVVARSGRTTIASAQRTSELLARIEAPIVGIVLTDVPRSLLSQRPSGRYYSAPPLGLKPSGASARHARPAGTWSIPAREDSA